MKLTLTATAKDRQDMRAVLHNVIASLHSPHTLGRSGQVPDDKIDARFHWDLEDYDEIPPNPHTVEITTGLLLAMEAIDEHEKRILDLVNPEVVASAFLEGPYALRMLVGLHCVLNRHRLTFDDLVSHTHTGDDDGIHGGSKHNTRSTKTSNQPVLH